MAFGAIDPGSKLSAPRGDVAAKLPASPSLSSGEMEDEGTPGGIRTSGLPTPSRSFRVPQPPASFRRVQMDSRSRNVRR